MIRFSFVFSREKLYFSCIEYIPRSILFYFSFSYSISCRNEISVDVVEGKKKRERLLFPVAYGGDDHLSSTRVQSEIFLINEGKKRIR